MENISRACIMDALATVATRVDIIFRIFLSYYRIYGCFNLNVSYCFLTLNVYLNKLIG